MRNKILTEKKISESCLQTVLFFVRHKILNPQKQTKIEKKKVKNKTGTDDISLKATTKNPIIRCNAEIQVYDV